MGGGGEGGGVKKYSWVFTVLSAYLSHFFSSPAAGPFFFPPDVYFFLSYFFMYIWYVQISPSTLESLSTSLSLYLPYGVFGGSLSPSLP